MTPEAERRLIMVAEEYEALHNLMATVVDAVCVIEDEALDHIFEWVNDALLDSKRRFVKAQIQAEQVARPLPGSQSL